MQKEKFLKKKSNKIMVAIWIIVFAELIYLSMYNNYQNKSYCMSKVGEDWFYGNFKDALKFYNERIVFKPNMKVYINNSLINFNPNKNFIIKNNYVPNSREIEEYFNSNVFICLKKDWKNNENG